MSKVGLPSYDRAPSRRLRQLLAPDGFLAPLLVKRTVRGVDLEVHLRRGDEVDLYCGLTCLVKSGRSRGGSVWIESHGRYAGQACASGLFRPGRTRPVDCSLILLTNNVVEFVRVDGLAFEDWLADKG